MCEEKRLLSCAVNPARDLLLKNRSKEAYWEELFDYIFFILLSPLSSQEMRLVVATQLRGNAPKEKRAKMFLHVGNNRNIMLKEIVGVFDLDTSTVSADTKRFLKESEKNGTTENAVLELPKSFVLTDDGKVIFSQISTASLMGRV